MGLVYPLPSQNHSLPGREIQLENCLGKTVLVVGGGGREHAIVEALSRSPQVAKIYCAPGNAGIGLKAFNVPLKDTDVEGLKNFAVDNAVDLTVVGPEAALAAGLTDAFRAAGLAVFGHTKAATAIESSKEFAKRLMEKYGEVGVTNIENPQILSLNPFAQIAKRPRIMKGIFKSPEEYNEAVKDLENELYKEA